MDDVKAASHSSGISNKNKSDEREGHGDDKTTPSLARDEGEEINYHTLSWW